MPRSFASVTDKLFKNYSHHGVGRKWEGGTAVELCGATTTKVNMEAWGGGSAESVFVLKYCLL